MRNKDFYTEATITSIEAGTIDPVSKRVIDQYVIICLRSGKTITFFQWSDPLFKDRDIGKDFLFMLELDCVNEMEIKKMTEKRYSLIQTFSSTTKIEGEVVSIEPYIYQRYKVILNAGDCYVQFYTNHVLKIGDFICIKGRLQISDFEEISNKSRGCLDAYPIDEKTEGGRKMI